MNRFEYITGPLTWFMALIMVALLSGCSGGGGQDTAPGTTYAPAVTAVFPASNAIGVPVNTKIISASFTGAMDPASLTPASFMLTCSGVPVTGTAPIDYQAAGSMATLTVPAATSLPPNAICTATVTVGAKDASGIPLTSNFAWSFTTGATINNTPPTVTGTFHANGATNVAINTKVGVTFSKFMDPTTITTTNFSLMQGATPVVGTMSYSGVSAVFVPLTNLAPDTRYTVAIKGGTGGVLDLAGNSMIGDFVISWTTGTAINNTSPMVSGTINANGATNIAINTRVGVTFSEGMDPLTITTKTISLMQGTTPVAGTVSYSGVSAVFVPSTNLAPDTRYTVAIKGGTGGVLDLAGNPMIGDFVYGWTTGTAAKNTPPTVTWTAIAHGATNVVINTNIGVMFSEGMDPLTITNQNLTLKETGTGKAVAGLVAYSGLNAEFGFIYGGFGPQLFYHLMPNTAYTATIKGGVGGVEDLSGNPMVSDYVWSWTTGADQDNTPPVVSLVSPTDLAQGVSINSMVIVTFSEAMDSQTINTANLKVEGMAGTVAYDASNRRATFIPSSNFLNGTTYTATVTTGVTDLAGKTLLANKTWRFTTAATTMP